MVLIVVYCFELFKGSISIGFYLTSYYAVFKVLAGKYSSSLVSLLLTLVLEFNSLSWVWVGGGKRTRTADFLRARQALYQLSYTPTEWAILDLNQRPHPYQGCALTN